MKIEFTYLTSPKAAGKSAVMAPPKRSTCLKVDMLFAPVKFRQFRFCRGEAIESLLLEFFFRTMSWKVGRVERKSGGHE